MEYSSIRNLSDEIKRTNNYLKKLIDENNTKKNNLKNLCDHDIIIYFSDNLINYDNPSERYAECLCCEKKYKFDKYSSQLNNFLNQSNVIDVSKIIDMNKEILDKSFFDKVLFEIRDKVDKYLVNNEFDFGVIEFLIERVFVNEYKALLKCYDNDDVLIKKLK